LQESLWRIPEALDIAREAIDLIQQGWELNFYPKCAAIGLTLLGLTGPIGATLISNGAALLAALNGLRPLMGNGWKPAGSALGGPRFRDQPSSRQAGMVHARKPA
jgi:cation transport ATPase